MSKLDGILGKLADGACEAVVEMFGSLCPITLGHVQCYIEARHIILNDPEGKSARPSRLQPFEECLGMVSLNGDPHVSSKLHEKG